jgi:CRISP-associated protein Cas1
MSYRILVITTTGIHLRLSNQQVVLCDGERILSTVPLDETLCVIIDCPGVTITSSLLSEMMEKRVMCIVTDNKHLPSGILLPISGHTLSSKRLRMQVELQEPTKKRVWRSLIVEKIKGQARVLRTLYGDDGGLISMSKKVTSGDTTNIEAQAARKYWTLLFETPQFKRARANPDQNRLLNYGYSIVRAAVARQLVTVGLHPSMGIHHRNQYNAFCLADDLVEPYRPFVDLSVAEWVKEHGVSEDLSRESKEHLIGTLLKEIFVDNFKCSLLRATELGAQALVNVLEKERSSWCALSW